MQATRLSRLVSLALFCGAGIVAVVMALRLGLWRDGSPGPGLFPFLASVGIVTLSAIGMAVAALQAAAQADAASIDARGIRRVAIYVGTLIGYALLLEPLGFHVATALVLFVILRLAERLQWRIVLPVILGALLFTHLLFGRWLGVYFPRGYVWDVFL